jgi:hypothetical protein
MWGVKIEDEGVVQMVIGVFFSLSSFLTIRIRKAMNTASRNRN